MKLYFIDGAKCGFMDYGMWGEVQKIGVTTNKDEGIDSNYYHKSQKSIKKDKNKKPPSKLNLKLNLKFNNGGGSLLTVW